MKNKTSLRGFTLLELIVVIAIIGVLSVIIIPSFTTALARSRDGRKIAELTGLQKSLAQWAQNNNGRYPATGTIPTKSAGCSGATSLCALVTSNITSRLPDGAFNGTGAGGVGPLYNYAGVACYSGGLCQSYQLWVDLEKSNQALSSDSDASGTATTTWRGIDWSAGGMILPVTAMMQNGETETCTGVQNTCIFDLRP
jgi:prepilin-type N-terminal cleavage/methylation domain-containing protein